jgi:hypothetical protein
MNFEFRYETPSFSQTHYGLEIRLGFDALGDADFLPATVLSASNTTATSRRFPAVRRAAAKDIRVTDFKLGVFDIELGLVPGPTSGSDRLVAEAILDTVSRSPAQRSQSAAAYEGSLAAGCREFSRFYRILFVAVTSGPARPAGWFHGARIPVLYGNRVLISCHSGRAPANLRGRYEQPQ